MRFEEYLQELFQNEFNEIPNKDDPDTFEKWICSLDPDDWFIYGDAFAGEKQAKLVTDLKTLKGLKI